MTAVHLVGGCNVMCNWLKELECVNGGVKTRNRSLSLVKICSV